MDEDSPDAAGDDLDATDEEARADTFGVGIHVTEDELRFVVHVPSSIDPGWTDPEAFQRLVERVVWAELDQEATLRAVSSSTPSGETVTLGTVTLSPDGTLVDHSLSAPRGRADDEAEGFDSRDDDGRTDTVENAGADDDGA
jgi:hypothetical protein